MFRKYFIAGLLVWVPIWVTLLVITFIINLFDRFVAILPKSYQPEHLLGFRVPGLGFVLTILVVFFTGLIITNFLGKRLVAFWEKIVGRIPLVRSIYNAVKQVMQTLLSTHGEAFRKVLLIQYPREGIWSLAFLTSSAFTRAEKFTNEKMLTVFVPTTPNPTSGFFMLVPAREAMELDVTVDEALKMIISLGVIVPEEKIETLPISPHQK